MGVEVDTLVFDCIPGGATVGGEPFLSAVRQGVFDGAEMTLYRAFMPTYGNTAAGTVIMFVGRVAEIDAGRSLATFTVNSHLELLTQPMPLNLYQSGCPEHAVRCELHAEHGELRREWHSGERIDGDRRQHQLAFAGVGVFQPRAGHFFTSGANSGFSRTVQAHTIGSPSTVALISPFPSVRSTGDAFTMYPGCDKQQSTCSAKFSNLINFRGTPYIPAAQHSGMRRNENQNVKRIICWFWRLISLE